MFYEKNKNKFDEKLFKTPTSEYRGAPFWSWNDDLDKAELLRQIEVLKEMGFGGFHMHVRSGMATPYLSDEFMDLVSACVDKAKDEKMLAYLYDEDRWPSGAAGGIVTKNYEYRQTYLIISRGKIGEKVDRETKEGAFVWNYRRPEFLAAFDVALNDDGTLGSYRVIGENDEAKGKKRYVYSVVAGDNGWFNNQAYLDTLDKDAVDEFIRVTHERYYGKIGKEFGKTVPSIFTDEPQFVACPPMPSAFSEGDMMRPWSRKFAEFFKSRYGYDLIDKLPEIIWDTADGPSKVRYDYHDALCQKFTEAFADNIGKWCSDHGFYLTGHVMREPTLPSQTGSVGETMRMYRGFGIPGIDMLCNYVELTTAKQCQSVVHQLGKEGMLSELYGVTGWDFDFCGHKFQGDWQAALGVTVRVPHLSWYSMKGSAKRDYPASVSYQSSWYAQYPLVEDHFARVNVAMTRGKPDVKVAVIHPIESYWLFDGPQDTTSEMKKQLQTDFDNVINWLLFGTIDFDYISESLLPEEYEESESGLKVGEMNYDAVVVAGVKTLRSSTVKILTEFIRKGGKVIFAGAKPEYVDAVRSFAADELYALAEKVPFDKYDLLTALEPYRDVSLRLGDGTRPDDYIYQMRRDGEDKWLFIARGRDFNENSKRESTYYRARRLSIEVKGNFIPALYDTISGNKFTPDYEQKDGKTLVYRDMYISDSVLLRLRPGKGNGKKSEKQERNVLRVVDYKDPVKYSTAEDNVLVLDMPEWSEDGENYNAKEEMLRIDALLRAKYGYPNADGRDAQPWVIGESKAEKSVYLKFTVPSAVAVKVRLAFEEAEEVFVNGEKANIVKNGYFTDKRIYTTDIPALKKGENVIVVKAPFGKRTSLENYFLLGAFGVKASGASAELTKRPARIGFGPLKDWGMPFYGAAITYELPLSLERESEVRLNASHFGAALLSVRVDRRECGRIAYSPFTVSLGTLKAGEHKVYVTAYVSRVNCFNALHAAVPLRWIGPGYWYTKGDEWSYEYCLKNTGVLKSPVIEILG